MKKAILYIPFLLVLIILVKGCNYENPVSTGNSNSQSITDVSTGIDPNTEFSVPIINYANEKVGYFKTWFDKRNIYFSFSSNSINYLKNIRFAISPNSNRIPLSGNCPDINKFTYQVLNIPGNLQNYVLTYSIAILPQNTKILFLSGEIEYVNSSNNTNCNTLWIQGTSFAGCSTFSKYLSIQYNLP